VVEIDVVLSVANLCVGGITGFAGLYPLFDGYFCGLVVVVVGGWWLVVLGEAVLGSLIGVVWRCAEPRIWMKWIILSQWSRSRELTRSFSLKNRVFGSCDESFFGIADSPTRLFGQTSCRSIRVTGYGEVGPFVGCCLFLGVRPTDRGPRLFFSHHTRTGGLGTVICSVITSLQAFRVGVSCVWWILWLGSMFIGRGRAGDCCLIDSGWL
jgi:hypothetical protein